MSDSTRYFRLGLFVLTGTALLVAGLMVLGAGVFTGPQMMLESYLNESVQGLDVGSPVRLRGVKIGQVERITFVDRVYATSHRYVLVRARITPEVAGETPEKVCAGIQQEVAAGLRVRLAAQGLTGTAYLEADYADPVRNPPLPIDWEPACIYVPSMPSTIRQLSDSVQHLLLKFEEMPLKDLLVDVNRLIATLQGLLKDDLRPAIRGMDENASIMAADVSDLSATVQRAIRDEIIPILENIRAMSAGLPVMVSNVNGTVDKADALLVSQRETVADAVANLRDAAADLKTLTDNARQYPAGTLFGDPPARVKPAPLTGNEERGR